MNPTCHEQVLAAAKAVVLRKGVNHFTIKEVVEQMAHVDSHCAKATITNHVASRCCVNLPVIAQRNAATSSGSVGASIESCEGRPFGFISLPMMLILESPPEDIESTDYVKDLAREGVYQPLDSTWTLLRAARRSISPGVIGYVRSSCA
jgi:hypothetical protein